MKGERLSSEERREEIIETSLQIIFNQGFSNLTMRNIAKRINISEAAIYRHFKNKKEILDYLIQPVFERNSSLKDIADEEDLLQVLENLMNQHLETVEKCPYITAILFQEEIFREFPDIRDRFKAHRLERERFIIYLVEMGKERNIISQDVDSEIFALLFMGSIRMSVLRWRGSEFSYSLEGEAKRICGELFKIIKVESDI